jgi:hypothetical protein
LSFERERIDLSDRIIFLLPAILGEALTEISLPIHEAHAYEGDTKITGRLQMIPGQDPQTAGVYGQTFGETELKGKVGRHKVNGMLEMIIVGSRSRHIGPELMPHAFGMLQVTLVIAYFGEAMTRETNQCLERVVVCIVPQILIEVLEEFNGLCVPTKPEIAGYFSEALKTSSRWGYNNVFS